MYHAKVMIFAQIHFETTEQEFSGMKV